MLLSADAPLNFIPYHTIPYHCPNAFRTVLPFIKLWCNEVSECENHSNRWNYWSNRVISMLLTITVWKREIVTALCFIISVNYYYYYYLPSVSIPEGSLKIDENKLLSPCSQGPAGCHVAEQHWNAAPAPKFADINDYSIWCHQKLRRSSCQDHSEDE